MRRALLFVLICGGCGGEARLAPVPPTPVASAPPVVAVVPRTCPARVDAAFAQEILTRHAVGYGSAAAVAAALPITLAGTLTAEGRTGTIETSITADAHRTQAFLGGIHAASGIDAKLAWTLEGGSGVVERLTPAEGTGAALDAWLLRRGYTARFEGDASAVRCQDGGGAATVAITFARADLGSPTLTFDRETASLLVVARTRAGGAELATTYDAWGPPDHGVRWPRRTSDHPVGASAKSFETTRVTHDLTCTRVEPSGAALPEQGAACVEPPVARFVLRWPPPDALGRTVVRLPMTYLGGEIIVRAKLGGREVNALLDSGAGVNAVDASLPAGLSFRPSIEVGGAGLTQTLRLGFGELPSIELGGLRAEHIPTVSVPLPVLEAFGDKRPELVLGYSFFASAVVRVDYIRREILIAKSAEGSFTKGGEPRAVPVRILGSQIIVDGTVEGHPAAFQVDTGSSGGLDLYTPWATAHDLPGKRPVVSLKGRFGAGTEATAAVFFTLGKAALGPIAFDSRTTHVVDTPNAGEIAGLAGNQVLARCDAVLFDVAKRQLWLEGACNRPVPERRIGWRFEKQVDPAQPDRPWIVGGLWPDGPAERAGIRIGDRVLEVGGKPASLDVGPLWTAEEQAAGTKVAVVVGRGGKRERVVVELRTLSP